MNYSSHYCSRIRELPGSLIPLALVLKLPGRDRNSCSVQWRIPLTPTPRGSDRHCFRWRSLSAWNHMLLLCTLPHGRATLARISWYNNRQQQCFNPGASGGVQKVWATEVSWLGSRPRLLASWTLPLFLHSCLDPTLSLSLLLSPSSVFTVSLCLRSCSFASSLFLQQLNHAYKQTSAPVSSQFSILQFPSVRARRVVGDNDIS